MTSRLTAGQKRGALVLLIILVSIGGWRWRADIFGGGEKAPLLTEEQAPADSSSQVSERNSFQSESPPGSNHAAPVLVDLNAADTTELMKVRGIGSVFASRIVKYRSLIGGFQRKDQLQNVYGIDPERYAGIASQVYVDTTGAAYQSLAAERIPQPDEAALEDPAPQEPPPTSPKDALTATPLPVFDLNAADSTSLVQVKGIGPGTARNIVKYRRLIYYFHTLDQLSEVWGIRPENLERMTAQLQLSGNYDAYPHIEVNKQDVEGLAQHKYLGYKAARLIVAYREQHGPYQNLADLQKIIGIDPALWPKLEPYLRY